MVCGLSNYFSKELGHELKIISINSSESHVFFPLDSSVEILHCGLDWHTQTFSKLCKLIGRTLRTLDADILITCHSTISYAVILNKRKFRGKVVVTQHSAVDSFSKKGTYAMLCYSALPISSLCSRKMTAEHLQDYIVLLKSFRMQALYGMTTVLHWSKKLLFPPED